MSKSKFERKKKTLASTEKKYGKIKWPEPKEEYDLRPLKKVCRERLDDNNKGWIPFKYLILTTKDILTHEEVCHFTPIMLNLMEFAEEYNQGKRNIW